MSQPTQTKAIIFVSPVLKGRPNPENFKYDHLPLPSLQDGQFLGQTLYLSVDPYLRGKMLGIKTYTDPFTVGAPLSSNAAIKVIDSKSSKFKIGDIVIGITNWAEYNVLNDTGYMKAIPNIPIETLFSTCGLTGLTAYFGLLDIGAIKQGETVLVTGAAGATGLVVGQIAKIYGAKVIGIAGSDEKVQLIKDLGFDVAINYKTVGNLAEAIAKAVPEKIDLFFDNVGGDQFDAVISSMKNFGRVVVCGSISTYNSESIPMGPRVNSSVIVKRLRLQGFIVTDFISRFEEGYTKLVQWYTEGKIKDKVTVVNGFENTLQAFWDLFDGKNTGKMIVKVA